MFFLVLSNSLAGIAQVLEDFSTGDQLNTTVWNGDADHFLIENGQLRLNAEGSGESTIWTMISESSTYEMQLDLRLDFAPSGSNRLTIYLWADEPSETAANAIYLSMGESGSDDDIELYERLDGVEKIVATGLMGSVGSAPVVLRLYIDAVDDQLRMRTMYDETVVNAPEIDVALSQQLAMDGYWGLQCNYTSTRADRFYFDNLYVGEQRSDSDSPRVISAIEQGGEIYVQLDETLDELATDHDSYQLQDGTIPDEVIISDFGRHVQLTFVDGVLVAGGEYELSVSVSDLYGNPLDTTLLITVPQPIVVGDLLLNEILTNPRAAGVDYLEIKNASDKRLSTAGLTIFNKDNGRSETVRSIVIPPGELAVFTDDPQKVIAEYPNGDASKIYLQDLPAFNNDDGNVTLQRGDLVLDELDYTDDYHHPLLSDDDGISLERLSLLSDNDDDNWTSSLASSGGTPGIENSVQSSETVGISTSLAYETFSPDGDGMRDELLIDYSTAGSEHVATISIYSDDGRLVRSLRNNEPLIGSGSVTWDGQNEEGAQMPIGIYIVHVRVTDLSSGKGYSAKHPCVLAGRL